ncbi:MAG TPA: NTP transferase domain-containing protein, partial [Solirubrobacteraceae bacterium]|nr:NTP transferase domain-containing protein [Solirubrobacteraceae bacterium]
VLSALLRAESIDSTYVVTCEPSLVQIASEHGALLVPDDDELGQSAAVTLGVRRALADGVQRVLCIPGDCPALDPRELDALLAGARAGADGTEDADGSPGAVQVVIVPDRHGSGTNGLLLCPPDAIAPSFGPDSFERHRRLALAAGVRARVQRPPSLLLDIDTGADLAVLRERLDASVAPALHTRAALGQPVQAHIMSVANAD